MLRSVEKPVIRYRDFMPLTLGEPAWVYPEGHIHFVPTTVVVMVDPDHHNPRPRFETAFARYEPSLWRELPYQNNLQERLA